MTSPSDTPTDSVQPKDHVDDKSVDEASSHDGSSQSEDSESGDSSEPSSSESESDSDDSDSESPDLISALLAAASGQPWTAAAGESISSPSSTLPRIPPGLLLNNPDGNPEPTTKPIMRSAESMVAQSSSLSQKLQAFLPQISESNLVLQQAKENGSLREWVVEAEEGVSEKGMIEMDLALGVLEEKQSAEADDKSKKGKAGAKVSVVEEDERATDA